MRLCRAVPQEEHSYARCSPERRRSSPCSATIVALRPRILSKMVSKAAETYHLVRSAQAVSGKRGARQRHATNARRSRVPKSSRGFFGTGCASSGNDTGLNVSRLAGDEEGRAVGDLVSRFDSRRCRRNKQQTGTENKYCGGINHMMRRGLFMLAVIVSAIQNHLLLLLRLLVCFLLLFVCVLLIFSSFSSRTSAVVWRSSSLRSGKRLRSS